MRSLADLWRVDFCADSTITQYGEDLPGFQALEHFIAGVHKGNTNVQTVLLTADAHIPNAQNPIPGAQMLVTGTNERNRVGSAPAEIYGAFYEAVKLETEALGHEAGCRMKKAPPPRGIH